ncbi:MAG: GNAT family N-acetyltransferase [Planctomycetota bacterium]
MARAEKSRLQLHPADTLATADLAALLNQGYRDYFAPVHLTEREIERSVRVDSVDLARSWVAVDGEKFVGAALTACRDDQWRLAGMVVMPAYRRRGCGYLLLDRIVNESLRCGIRRIYLEVIQANMPAIRLYEQFGFEVRRELVGFQGAIADEPTAAPPSVASLRDIADAIARWGYPDLPWQASAATIAALEPPTVGYRLEAALAAVTPMESRDVVLRALVVPAPARRAGLAAAMLRGLAHCWPGVRIHAPAYLPREGFESLFASVGLTPSDIRQTQMFRTNE